MSKSWLKISLWGFLALTLVIFATDTAVAQEPVKRHPPFLLRAETGEIINPLTGENANLPYSPRQTCGASNCHDYDTITKGYHFQQGADEYDENFNPDRPWVKSPGMFGKY
ncbi:MAG TPA: hypothetical protein EYP04_01270 [Anaerolineae bacterium]|nr:hypothetical protein [Anaerolineae bacterium]